ncbi:Ectonucleotide pyrophosphatase/phosphodiesterase family member 3 [Microtus ochrogaster]|uniref:Ectonucleotide pyrophosphatase/phosphodiesterase family member 3 n=1 Tax=Microtus ochrogaster TaxID=79684 RepID=A0A8J6GQD0_MICOH|nr:Ectonucleotide pyrophosphatase/phosphodiesterase family member 3 [Microtus ochrogaster]
MLLFFAFHLTGSCRKKCFDSSHRGLEGCRCDSECTGRGDCCWDFEDTCVKSTQIWTCNSFRCGESRLESSLCSCADDCLERKDCCADYRTVCHGEAPWVSEACATSQEPQCPEGFDLPPVILFSMDGFRAEYLQTWSTLVPNINKLKTCGIHSKYMRAMYPTKTFPNHYTIVTVIKALQLVDNAFGMLMEGLKQRNLHNCVNIILLADHVNSEEIVRNLSCRKPDQHFKPYLTPDLPKRLHYANHVRIDKVHLMVDRQWLAARGPSSSSCGGGNHGYNNEFKSMEAIFLAHGPSFKDSVEIEPFDNIEVYNLLCVTVRWRGSGSSLTQDDQVEQVNQMLNLSNGDITATMKANLPFGRPRLIQQNKEQCLLYHRQYISGFDKDMKMAMWSSYTVPNPGGTSPLPPTVPDCLRADVRVAPSESQKCSFYLADKNITHGFLYPPAINRASNSQYDALITSNLVPMYEEFKRMWDYFHVVLLLKHAVERNGVNVVSGPIFDYNYDGHFDSPDEITQYVADTDVPIPTHYFVVLTSCKNKFYTPDNCSGSLDVLPFIIPHRPTNVESCPEDKTEDLWVEERFNAHVARVRDVELLTGLDFYQEKAQPVSEILQLKTYLPVFETII